MKSSVMTLQKIDSSKAALWRIMALWAFVESGLGGFLHAIRMPLTGFVVGGIAIILIRLIYHHSDHFRTDLFKILSFVLLIKFLVSPHSPPTAYLAVAFQAVSAWIFYSLFSSEKLAAGTHALIAMLETAMQKLITLTIIFGIGFWTALDEFGEFAGRQIGLDFQNFGLGLLILYLGIYLFAASIVLFIGQLLVKIH